MRRLFPLACAVFAAATLAAADDPAKEDRAKAEAAVAEKLCADELANWKLTLDGVALDNPREPALRWTNPSAGRVYGNTYVWLRDGRPVAVGGMFRIFQPWNTFNGELAALTGPGLVAKRGDKVIWEPKARWAWHPIPSSAAPAAAAGQRLVQMKSLAGEFAAEVLDTRNVAKGEAQTPRLLRKPLYRYDAARTKSLDGALFAFVLGTDPELLLLLECDTALEKPEWRFGVVRMNRDAIRLKRSGKVVWEAEACREHSPEDAYLFFDIALQKKAPEPERKP